MGRVLLVLSILALCFAVAAFADHGKPALRIIADTDTPVPGGGGGTFAGFFQLDGVDPDISGRNIVFTGCCPTGVYRWFDGELGVIADLNSTFPGTSNPLGFGVATGSSPSISGENVAFACSDGRPGPGAVCAYINGKLESIAQGGVTLVPETNETFGTFFSLNGSGPSISGTNVAFVANSDFFNGVYARINGKLVTIADNNTPVPGQPGLTFQNFAQLSGASPSISGENVAFVGQWSGGLGAYAYIDGELQMIGDTTTTGGLFGAKGGGPSISGNNVAFLGSGGMYAYINGQVQLIVDTNTPAPGSEGAFGGFPVSPVLDGRNLGFGAGVSGIGSGIYAYIDSGFQLIANRNTPVPGHEDITFESFDLADRPAFDGEGVRASISGENVVFYGDGRLPGKQKQFVEGIYARIHEPPIPTASTWGLIALTLLLLSAGIVVLRRRPELGRDKSAM